MESVVSFYMVGTVDSGAQPVLPSIGGRDVGMAKCPCHERRSAKQSAFAAILR